MRPSAPNGERPTLLELTRSADFAARICDVVASVSTAADEAEAVALLKQAVECFGADAAVFVSFIRDDATLASYRYLLACDPLWGVEYARRGWCSDDPWLRHALATSEPIRASELPLGTERQQEFINTVATLGFASTVIAPAPSAAGQSRVGVLYLGASTAGYFEDAGYAAARVLARTLAMELHEWWHQRIRHELLSRIRITDDELILLRHEEAGHSSKVIAAALHTEAKTIDCRFQRLSAKLGAANRRIAVRLAKLYGLI